MKKLLVALVALTTVSAFAGNSMVRLDGCFDGTCDTLDFDMASDDADAKSESQTIAFNYAMAFAGNYGAGLTFAQSTETTDGDVMTVGDKSQTVGVSFYWNKDGSWSDSCFAALHYNMTSNDDTEATTDSGNKNTDIVLEYGHRFKIGSVMGLDWNWAPSVSYTMGTKVYNDDSKDDLKSTSLSLNVANVAVSF